MYISESCSFIISLHLPSLSTNNVITISLKNSFIANSKNKLSFSSNFETHNFINNYIYIITAHDYIDSIHKKSDNLTIVIPLSCHIWIEEQFLILLISCNVLCNYNYRLYFTTLILQLIFIVNS